MDVELRCPQCHEFYHVPVLLQCHHAVCLSCAGTLQKSTNHLRGGDEEGVSSNSDEASSCESDKLSILSDADSGVSSCSSRPASLLEGGSAETLTPPSYTVACPRCGVATPTDEGGAQGLPKYRVLAAVVDKHLERYQVAEPCQLCEGDGEARPAQVFCDQCLVFYCQDCRDTCHPSRGPLASHWLVTVSEGRALLRARRREREGKCPLHLQDCVSMYCLTCRLAVCAVCLHQGRHIAHNVHALNVINKTNKTELSQSLQHLSERAKGATEFIQSLKGITEEVHDNCKEVEDVVTSKVDTLVQTLLTRRSELVTWVRRQRDAKVKVLKDQVQEYTCNLQSTTSTIHFCIEALKESDPVSFLEAQEVLEGQVSAMAHDWDENMCPHPRVPPTFTLDLDDQTLLSAIRQLTFVQLKPPEAPQIIADECSAENNVVTIAWASYTPPACISGYQLEIDDGANGQFREVYTGEETLCTVDGLHFDCVYRARVRAFNSIGHSAYCEPISLQTSQFAWFVLSSPHPDLHLTRGGAGVTCDSYETRVCLGSVGFSRGVHYWMFSVERYDGNGDISFGVARSDVDKEAILGKCKGSWGMYVDSERSWLMHAGEHFSRTSGGIRTGDTIGILLCLTPDHTLTFYINRIKLGTMALSVTKGVLYPAVSLNRSAALSLHSGLCPPED